MYIYINIFRGLGLRVLQGFMFLESRVTIWG